MARYLGITQRIPAAPEPSSDGAPSRNNWKTPACRPRLQYPPRRAPAGIPTTLPMSPDPATIPVALRTVSSCDQSTPPSVCTQRWGAVKLATPTNHSTVHSSTFPIMSSAPQVLTHLDRRPACRGPVLSVTHRPSSPVLVVVGSSVPSAARSHSAPVAKRLPAAAQDRFA